MRWAPAARLRKISPPPPNCCAASPAFTTRPRAPPPRFNPSLSLPPQKGFSPPMLVLSGILVVIVGFVAGFNPLLVVTVAGFVTGLSAGINPITILGDFGHAFITSRFVALIWLVVPVVGLL